MEGLRYRLFVSAASETLDEAIGGLCARIQEIGAVGDGRAVGDGGIVGDCGAVGDGGAVGDYGAVGDGGVRVLKVYIGLAYCEGETLDSVQRRVDTRLQVLLGAENAPAVSVVAQKGLTAGGATADSAEGVLTAGAATDSAAGAAAGGLTAAGAAAGGLTAAGAAETGAAGYSAAGGVATAGAAASAAGGLTAEIWYLPKASEIKAKSFQFGGLTHVLVEDGERRELWSSGFHAEYAGGAAGGVATAGAAGVLTAAGAATDSAAGGVATAGSAAGGVATAGAAGVLSAAGAAAGVLTAAGAAGVLTAATSCFEALSALLKECGFTYDDIFRQWNYIGHILEICESGGKRLQNYQIFNEVRGVYYQNRKDRTQYPAATGIGMDYAGICIDMVAVKGPREQSLNLPLRSPVQKDAFRYGQAALVGDRPETGVSGKTEKEAPLFERGRCLLSYARGNTTAMVSGTASIVGEATIDKDNASKQLENTLAFIDRLVRHGLPGKELCFDRVRLYVKPGFMRAELAEILQRHYPASCLCVIVEADICRTDLLIEAEADLHTC